jgi:hypothetical protein
MAKISLKILLIALTSSFVFFFNSDKTKSCGPDYDDNPFINGLFEPSIIKDDSLSAFFLSPSFFSDYSKMSLLNPEVDNIKEWKGYFRDKYSSEELLNIIYKTSPEDISLLNNAKINNDFSSIPKRLAKNSVAKAFVAGEYTDAFRYLIYAKECEPHVTDNRKYGWGELIRDTSAMRALLENGKLSYEKTTDKFLKERYAYQCIRLSHYLKDFNLTINLFDELLTPLDSKSIIYYWALSHKAGAIRSNGDITYSSYLFSTIFDKCLSRRLIASQNFKSLDASLLYETLDYCEDNHEKTSVWFLHAYLTNDFGSLKKIYELEPKSTYLEILLTRAIDQMENDIYAYWNRNENTSWSNQFVRLDFPNFYNFIYSCAKKENTNRPYFWYYAAGYVALLKQDYAAMRENFNEVKRFITTGENEYLDRIRMLETLGAVDEIDVVDITFEKNILSDVKWVLDLKKNNSDEAFIWMMNRFSEKYYKQQDTAKAQLCLGFRLGKGDYTKTVDWVDYLSNPSSAPLDIMIRFVESDYNRTDFDKFLIQNFCYSLKDLYEIRGTLMLSRFNFDEALLWNFSNIKKELPLLPADPFSINIKDCSRCDEKALTTKLYTKHSFTKKMKELESEIKSTTKNRAENYFLLANAYYNMTYFGNSWMIVDFYRSQNMDGYSYNNIDCSKAEEYYLKAATFSNDKEFQAKCLFMAAKCEQNKFYVDKGHFDHNIYYYPYDCEQKPEIKLQNYRMYFKILNEKYSKTKFFKEALKECKYFNYFVTGK